MKWKGCFDVLSSMKGHQKPSCITGPCELLRVLVLMMTFTCTSSVSQDLAVGCQQSVDCLWVRLLTVKADLLG